METIEDADTSNSDEFADLIQDIYGENFWLAGGAKAGFYMTNFAIIYYAQAELNAYVSNPTYTTFDMSYKYDTGFHLGFAYEIAPNLHAGLGLRTVSRTGGEMPISVEIIENLDGNDIEDELMREGTGFGGDFGLLYKSDIGIKPSLAFSWLNFGNTTFKAAAGSERPSTEKQYMAVGLGAEIDLPLISIRPAMDIKFIDRSEISLAKKIGFGVEVDLPLITARAGFHQGYYTLGGSVDLFLLRLDAATYAEELGGYAGQQEDRRYIVQLTLELGMDTDFNFFRMDSKARRSIKQRR